VSRAQVVRQSFNEQAEWCRRLGSPFTALLCATLADSLDETGDVGREVLGWQGDPSMGDALPLRMAGAFHALARGDSEPQLARLYPPAPLPDVATLRTACTRALARQPALFRRYLGTAPQTNEVGRSAVLMPGLLEFARHFAVPLHLFEIGASAGLNLIPDRYRFRFGDATWGDRAAPLELAPEWSGDPPAVEVGLQIDSRQGADLAPIDIYSPAGRDALMSYAWPDQPERLQRLEAAIRTARAAPTTIDAAEAAEWVDRQLPPRDAARSGGRVLFHSVMWRYLRPDSQRRIEGRVAACGAAATRAQPFGWLRFELGAGGQGMLTLTAWPPGETRVLATAHPHGRTIHWLP